MELSHSTESDWNEYVGESTEDKGDNQALWNSFGWILSLISQGIYDVKATIGKENQHSSSESTLKATLICQDKGCEVAYIKVS